MRLRSRSVAVLLAALVAVGGAAAARVRVQVVVHHCRAESNAVGISATALSCSRAASAILTYEGAPLGCTTGPWCVQSGSDTRGGSAADGCQRGGQDRNQEKSKPHRRQSRAEHSSIKASTR